MKYCSLMSMCFICEISIDSLTFSEQFPHNDKNSAAAQCFISPHLALLSPATTLFHQSGFQPQQAAVFSPEPAINTQHATCPAPHGKQRCVTVAGGERSGEFSS